MSKPSVFIGSSTEGLEVAQALKYQLRHDADVTVWNEGVFALGKSYLESLTEALDKFDFAILVYRADDAVTSRSITSPATRGNVLFELGLFMGRLGRTKTFVVYDEHNPPSIISDLLGVSFAPYNGAGDNLLSEVGNSCYPIRQALKTASENSKKSSQSLFFETSGDYGTASSWLHLLQETENVFDIMGVALQAWRRTKNFRPVLTQKAMSGCHVRILLMHPDNPALTGLIYTRGGEESYDSVIQDIDQSAKYYRTIAQGRENIEVRQMLQGYPHFFLTRADQKAVTIQYLYAETWGNGPLWECSKGSKLYTILSEEFEALWEMNNEALRS
jgi:hypothetical protein